MISFWPNCLLQDCCQESATLDEPLNGMLLRLLKVDGSYWVGTERDFQSPPILGAGPHCCWAPIGSGGPSRRYATTARDGGASELLRQEGVAPRCRAPASEAGCR